MFGETEGRARRRAGFCDRAWGNETAVGAWYNGKTDERIEVATLSQVGE